MPKYEEPMQERFTTTLDKRVAVLHSHVDAFKRRVGEHLGST